MRPVLVGLFGCAALAAGAATYTWTGAGDATKWTDKANWGGAGYPTGGDTAKFTADAKNITENFEIGPGVMAVDVASGKDVYLKGVVSGAGGIKKTGNGKFRLYNQANTYAGTTECAGGELWFYTLANIGEASSFGAPAEENAQIKLSSGTLYMETQSNAAAAYSTDRPFDLNGFFRGSMQPGVKVDLHGALTGKSCTWRGAITFNVHVPIPSTFTGKFGRTDNGVVNMLCPTNEYLLGSSTTLEMSDGTFRGTIADKGLPSGLGAGNSIQFGQQNYPTTGAIFYNGTTSTNCNRDLMIMVATNGNYTTARYGGRLRNETAGTCVTFDGALTQSKSAAYEAHNAPWLWVGGAGDGVFAAPLTDNLSIEKEQAGTWTLTGASTSTGRVNVVAGRLDIDGSISDGTGYDGPKVSVGKDTYLGGTGTVYGTTQIAMGGHLAPGHANAIGTLNFGPARLRLNATSTLHIRLGDGTNDCVRSTGDVTCSGSGIQVAVTANGVAKPGVYTLIEAANLLAPSFTLAPGAPEGSTLAVQGNRLVLYVKEPAARSLVWRGAQGNAWDASTENWLADGAAATFTDGDAVSFTDAGTETNVEIPGNVAPSGVSVSSETANYTLGGTGSITGFCGVVKAGASTLTLEGSHAYQMPTEVKEGKLVLKGSVRDSSFDVAHNAVFDQAADSVIAGDAVTLTFGYGNHNLRGPNTFRGTVNYVTTGGHTGKGDVSLNLWGTRPLGYASAITVTGYASDYDTCTFLALRRDTVVEDVRFVFGTAPGNYRAFLLKANDGGAGSWYGDVELQGIANKAQQYFRSDGGTLVIGRPGGTNVITGPTGFSFRGGGTIHVHSRIETPSGLGRDDAGTVVLFCPSNAYGDTTCVQGTVQLGGANGWCTNAQMSLGKGSASAHVAFNLDGFDQTLCGLREVQTAYAGPNSTRVVSTPAGKPATLTLDQRSDTVWGSSYGFSYIRGPLSLVKKGAKSFTLDGTNAFTGTTTVEAGLLKASVLGALGGTTNVVVKGGTLQLAASKALNEQADLRFPAGSTGKIQLDAGVEQAVQYLFVDDKDVPCAPGTYGSSQSAAAHRDDTRFVGTGVLTVRRGGGFVILFR
ncbi:MAG: autotransporter-associated beta strand repeat-containing protein [Kiritimatiellae bacterium]|nr:autotransporter-associated beta strand repeat-containing protein [Kiritimatiellia bacterium]